MPTPSFITDGIFITVIGIPHILLITLTLFSSQTSSIPDISIFISFILSMRTVTLLSPSGKKIPLNSRLYLPPSVTGKESVNEELSQTASYGAASPLMVTSLPCNTSSGTFSSLTSPLATETVQSGIAIAIVNITIAINPFTIPEPCHIPSPIIYHQPAQPALINVSPLTPTAHSQVNLSRAYH